jgi:hypothetical protein
MTQPALARPWFSAQQLLLTVLPSGGQRRARSNAMTAMVAASAQSSARTAAIGALTPAARTAAPR